MALNPTLKVRDVNYRFHFPNIDEIYLYGIRNRVPPHRKE